MTTENQETTSPEDKFFGIQTPVSRGEEEGEIEVTTTEAEETQAAEGKEETAAAEVTATDDAHREEVDEYSERVKKRIGKLTYKQKQAQRERDEALALRDEAVRVAQQLNQTNQQYRETITNGEAMLVEKFKTSAEMAFQNAEAQYRKAHEEGDTDAVITAQRAMLRAQTEQQEADRYEQDYLYRRQQQPAPGNFQQRVPQTVAPAAPRPQVPKPTQRAQQWAEENPWFGDAEHPDMTALAYGIHERLTGREGLAPDSDEYFSELDKEMRGHFPAYFGDNRASGDMPSSTTGKGTTTVVASGERNNGARPRKVTLTPTQQTLAKRLGLTNQQYAEQLIKGGI